MQIRNVIFDFGGVLIDWNPRYLYRKVFDNDEQMEYFLDNICTTEYYNKAVHIIKKEISNPTFYIFSDDIEWVKNNLPLENACYIDWNTGNQSIYDMYLMTNAKAHIIANSTFSYWGAMLSKSSLITIYPKKWFNSKFAVPNIFPQNWIGL